ncbi:hypothetical protein [Prevotella sp. P4-67]|uniref:hypothetical protein n=1 Tax=Prevotella sp. P4-67 TaxID=2024227 RepID=UPI0011866AC2|nr:hypothetical protein [Prevotella sp. P4-67]
MVSIFLFIEYKGSISWAKYKTNLRFFYSTSLIFTASGVRTGCVSTMPNEKTFDFSLHCLRLALLYSGAVKVGGTSRIKINEFILYSLRFALFTAPAVKVGGTSRIKINEFILYSLRFALPLDKVGCVSTMPNEKTFVFSLHCLRLALPLHIHNYI